MVDDTKKGKEVSIGENNGHIKLKNYETNPYGDKIEDWNRKREIWVFIPVLDCNRRLIPPVYLNGILNSLFRY